MKHILAHIKAEKVDGVFHITTRTKEAANMLQRLSDKKGIKAVYNYTGVPTYYLSEQHKLEVFCKKAPILKDFVNELGLKLL